MTNLYKAKIILWKLNNWVFRLSKIKKDLILFKKIITVQRNLTIKFGVLFFLWI